MTHAASVYLGYPPTPWRSRLVQHPHRATSQKPFKSAPFLHFESSARILCAKRSQVAAQSIVFAEVWRDVTAPRHLPRSVRAGGSERDFARIHLKPEK